MLSILLASPASGQTMAALQGRVFDSSGAVLPGGSVAIRDLATGLISVAPTNGLDEAAKRGWVIVDMKRDWKVIYPELR